MNINSNSVAPQKWLQQLEMWCSHKLKLMEFPLSSPYCFNFAKWPSYFNNLDHYYLGKNIYFKTEDPTQLRDPLQISYGKVWVGKQSVTWLMFIYREHLSRVVTISYTTRIGVQIRCALRTLSEIQGRLFPIQGTQFTQTSKLWLRSTRNKKTIWMKIQ